MIRNETRESAHLRSRVKDLSVVPNVVSYTGLFAAITPLAKLEKNPVTDCYDPILIRDTDSLIANFGDPRIDPNKYIDLYSIMQAVGNGATCYVAKVPSGDTGTYSWETAVPNVLSESIKLNHASGDTTGMVFESGEVSVLYDILAITKNSEAGDPDVITNENFTVSTRETVDGYIYTITLLSTPAPSEEDELFITRVARHSLSMTAYSSMSDGLNVHVTLMQAKPLSLKGYYLIVDVYNTVEGRPNKLASAKVKLDSNTTNQTLVNAINSAVGSYLRFELNDKSTAGAYEGDGDGNPDSIVQAILDAYAPHAGNDRSKPRDDIDPTDGKYEVDLSEFISELTAPNFSVSLDDYRKALDQYKAKKYTGCLMADLTAPMHYTYTPEGSSTQQVTFGVPSHEDRRSLHYYIKDVARERKDCTVVLSAPLQLNCTDNTILEWDQICEWVSSTGSYTELWGYGQTNTADYAEQSFYLEMYASWLKMQCTKIVNGSAGSEIVNVAPSNLVINNILTSYRERGVQYPVAGDQYGVLPSSCTVIKNPDTKMIRDQLVQYRINPIYDTGTRGVQIYGNETLNAGYTDLNAAHIARTLVNIRHQVDEYTETLKFLINSQILWDQWKNYVSMYILEPFKAANALAEYDVKMGEDTTSRAEIANRTINGVISLRFYQAAEIFDLTFVVYSTATTLEEEGVI